MSEQSGFSDGHKQPKMVHPDELQKKPSKLKKNKKDDTTTWRATENLNRQDGWFDGPDGCLNGCLFIVSGIILFCVLMALCVGCT